MSLLKFLREQPLSVPAVVLVLLVVIVVSAVLAGPIAGFTASLIAALSFDFLFVAPYRVLKLSPIGELWPAVLLLVAGVSVVWVIAVAGNTQAATEAQSPRRGRIRRSTFNALPS